MRFVALFYLTLSSVIAADGETIRAFGHTWTVPIASDWKIEDGQVPVLPSRNHAQNAKQPAISTLPYPDLKLSLAGRSSSRSPRLHRGKTLP